MTDCSELPDVFRQAMPIAGRWTYLDHAAVAPLSGPAQRAMAEWTRQAAEQGDTLWPQWSRRVEETRRLAAELIGATPAEIALIPNTSAGIDLVAEGYRWQEGDNVVTLDNEFPANLYPWLNLGARGVETRRVATDASGAVDLDRLADACDARTRIVSISWVGYATGYRHDLAAVADIAHRAGALLLVDAIQGLGVFPINMAEADIDFLAADGHKWLLGPEGAGIFFLRREHLDRLRPVNVGWNSVIAPMDFHRPHFELKPTAARYEGGSHNMVGLIGLGASLELLLQLGTASVGRALLAITDLACRRLEAIGAEVVSCRQGEHRSGIVAFTLPGLEPNAARRAAFDQRIALSARAGRIRISPHAYNRPEEIERLVDLLVACRR